MGQKSKSTGTVPVVGNVEIEMSGGNRNIVCRDVDKLCKTFLKKKKKKHVYFIYRRVKLCITI